MVALVFVAALVVAMSLTRPNAEAKGGGDGKRGEYLVKAGGCADCHTPMKIGPNGPEPDMSRNLSGHPEAMVMPPAPKLEMPWGGAFSVTNTAWSGPWGVSFVANITADKPTGIGDWSEATFMQAIRTGRHLGKGRPILPPMPIPAMQQLTDADLKAIFSYLKVTSAVKNRAPDPLPPAPAQPHK
jgi:mono/diheme cytochrome c family protein